MIKLGSPSVVLAPMEGVTDAPMRHLLTETAHFTHVVSEFIRVSQQPPPQKTFYEYAPELKTGCKTVTQVPVIVQLLGGNCERLTASAVLAAGLGAQHIDMNFGCPAPTVNRHDGGATLLKFPDRIYEILTSLKQALPAHVTVSAKVRLGFDDPNAIYKNAEMAFKAGVDWLTIHARTKTQGYRPPVDWKMIADVKKNAPVPVVANGDIWTFDDYRRCRDITQCEHFMLGRGVLLNPFLASLISDDLGIKKINSAAEREFYLAPGEDFWKQIFLRMFQVSQLYGENPNVVLRRVKQWLSLRETRIPSESFVTIKRLSTYQDFLQLTKCEFPFTMNYP